MTAAANLLHVRRSGSGPTVVLIHGVVGSGAIWERLVPLLEPHFDLIRLDLLGYGFSPKPPAAYDTACQVAAIHATLAPLRLTQPYAVIGLSMGAMLALDYAAAYPAEVTAIVCLGLPYYRDTTEAIASLRRNFWMNLVLQHPQLARWLIPPAWAATRRSHVVRRLFKPPHYSDQVTKEAALASEPAFAASVRTIMRDHRIAAALPRVQATPKLFVHGDRDQWTPAGRVRDLAASLRHAHFEEIPDCPHNVAILQPEVTARLCSSFLQTTTQI